MDEASATETVPGRFKPYLNLVLTLILCCVHYIQWDCEASTCPTRAVNRMAGGRSARNTLWSLCRLLANLQLKLNLKFISE